MYDVEVVPTQEPQINTNNTEGLGSTAVFGDHADCAEREGYTLHVHVLEQRTTTNDCKNGHRKGFFISSDRMRHDRMPRRPASTVTGHPQAAPVGLGIRNVTTL